MAKLPPFDSIEFLLDRKFGTHWRPISLPGSLSAGKWQRAKPELERQVAAYRAYLAQLSPEELQAVLDSEREKQRAGLVAKAERDEQARFFNQPSAQADFDHWSKAAHWTLDEAIALSFGKAPETVNWEKVRPFCQVSAFAVQYQRRRDLARRAAVWKQLFDPVLPGIFLAWAKRSDLAVPPELEAAVAARGVQIADWKSLYDDLKATFDEHQKGWMALSKEKDELLDKLQARVAELEACDVLAGLSPKAEEKFIAARERDSLLRMVIGMAVGGYGYDPSALRSKQTSEIESDLATAGVPLDVDTVRKWLKEAAELLPPKETE